MARPGSIPRPSLSAVGAALLLSVPSAAQVADVQLRGNFFYEPSATSHVTVLNPTLDASAQPVEGVRVRAGYEADIVSGASEAVKAGRLTSVDVVSSATSFHDTRQVASGGVTLARESTELSATYAYGTESDYRSHSIAVSAKTSFLQRNTELSLGYARGFDQVCTSAFATAIAPSARIALDSSKGCFTKAENRASRDVDLDTLRAGWTQAWSPIWSTQLVATFALQHGFLANPYRSVVIAPAGDVALENHPENRARAALTLRSRWYLRGPKLAVGASIHLYRDTWDIDAQSYELEAERYLFSALRVAVRARYYHQGAALFFSDDYTGGEPADGPRGQYWSGDRELSRLSNYGLGARIAYARRAEPNTRILGILKGVSASLGVDALKTHLSGFTWAGVEPDDTLALLASLALGSEF
ncbi:MAG TPA: DUF3570 domain-containing protein [Polyangiaceae bacterium]|nr:DUF3570 domain-containing protein [Polyangiaceae bacterium]